MWVENVAYIILLYLLDSNTVPQIVSDSKKNIKEGWLTERDKYRMISLICGI